MPAEWEITLDVLRIFIFSLQLLECGAHPNLGNLDKPPANGGFVYFLFFFF